MADNSIDPRFFLPPNVINLGYKDTSEPSNDAPTEVGGDEVDVVITQVDYIPEMEGTFEDENRLLPPDYITLVSQTARVTSGGTFVDVVIDVEDVANIGQFEVRITK